jgi:hypothetical protein
MKGSRHVSAVFGLMTSVVLLVGCASAPSQGSTGLSAGSLGAKRAPAHDPHDHNHARGAMLLASDGVSNALLTAHLAPSGNELDIFLEDGRTGKPKAISLVELTASARSESSAALQEVRFTCAPADERPRDEAAGMCSHFVAKVSWLRAQDVLHVESTVLFDGKPSMFTWREFGARRYAHHAEPGAL